MNEQNDTPKGYIKPEYKTPTRTQRLKKWVSEHQEGVVMGTVGAAVIGLYAAVFVYAAKETNRQAEEAKQYIRGLNEWANEEQQAGRDVFELADGTFITAPKSTDIVRYYF